MSLGRPAPAHHKCPRHLWTRLYRDPQTAAERTQYFLLDLGRYFECKTCGRIGRLRNSAHALIVPISKDAEAYRREQARSFGVQ